MINHEAGCIYVHIPKTAGNSINRAFGIGWEDHRDIRRCAECVSPAEFERYLKFAVVRNPWDRLFSDYNYQCRKSRSRDSKLFVFDADGRRRNFREWVRAALSDPTVYPPSAWGGDVSPGIHRWSPQVDWITLDGRIAVDRILRLESLDAGYAQVCSDLGRPAGRLPRRNRRFHLHYSWYFDDATRALVSAYYAEDIRQFGYSYVDRASSLRVFAQSLISPRPLTT